MSSTSQEGSDPYSVSVLLSPVDEETEVSVWWKNHFLSTISRVVHWLKFSREGERLDPEQYCFHVDLCRIREEERGRKGGKGRRKGRAEVVRYSDCVYILYMCTCVLYKIRITVNYRKLIQFSINDFDH